VVVVVAAAAVVVAAAAAVVVVVVGVGVAVDLVAVDLVVDVGDEARARRSGRFFLTVASVQ
jgi:hypothetical protein